MEINCHPFGIEEETASEGHRTQGHRRAKRGAHQHEGRPWPPNHSPSDWPGLLPQGGKAEAASASNPEPEVLCKREVGGRDGGVRLPQFKQRQRGSVTDEDNTRPPPP